MAIEDYEKKQSFGDVVFTKILAFITSPTNWRKQYEEIMEESEKLENEGIKTSREYWKKSDKKERFGLLFGGLNIVGYVALTGLTVYFVVRLIIKFFS